MLAAPANTARGHLEYSSQPQQSQANISNLDHARRDGDELLEFG